MLGFGSIAEFAIAEFGEQEVQVLVPAVDAALEVQTPAVSSGASIGVPTVTMAAAPQIPSLRTGAAILPGAIPGVFVPATVQVEQSAKITLTTTLTAAFGPQAPFIAGGKSVVAAQASFASATQAPSISSGGTVLPGTAEDLFVPEVIRIEQSATVTLPVIAESVFAPFPLATEGGATILWESQDISDTFGGSIGEGSIGEYSIGEGEPRVHVIARVPDMALMNPRPFVASGGAALPPAANDSFVGQTPEIDARRRKVRTLGIAS